VNLGIASLSERTSIDCLTQELLLFMQKKWTISVVKTARKNYGAYRGNDLSADILKTEGNSKFPMVLKKRMSVTS
jgi:DNA-binding HxlR family transcriptional regulator